MFGSKGNGIAAGMAIQSVLAVDSGCISGHQQGGFGGIAHQALTVAGSGIVAEQAGQQGFLQGRIRCPRQAIPRPEILDRHQLAAPIKVLHRHPVLGEGAGLVGANDGSAAKGFHGRQLADDGPPPGHAVHAYGKGDRHDCRQLFRDRAHRQGHGPIKHLIGAAPPRQPHQKREPSQHQNRLQQAVTETGELAGERRGEIHLLLQGAGDAAHLGVIPGGHHQPQAVTGCHVTARVGHADPLRKGGGRLHGGGALVHRQRFPGEGRFIGLQVAPLQQPQVGRHPRPSLQLHQIARYQLLRGQALARATAHHLHLGAHRSRQGGDRVLGLALLHEADHGIDHRDAPDHQGIARVTQQRLHRPDHQQGDQQGIVELEQKLQPAGLAAPDCERIGAMGMEPALGFRLAQAGGAIALQGRHHIGRWPGMGWCGQGLHGAAQCLGSRPSAFPIA